MPETPDTKKGGCESLAAWWWRRFRIWRQGRSDVRLKMYSPHRHRNDVLLLSALSRGNVDTTLSSARDRLEADGRLYICDVRMCPLPTGPNVRGLRKPNLQRWMDRAGLVMVWCREDKELIYAVARKATEEELQIHTEQKRGMIHAYSNDEC